MDEIAISLSISDEGSVALSLGADEGVTLKLGEPYIDGGGEEYEGVYQVVPMVGRDQTLPTKYKKMADDVTVYAIPDARVSNPAGGYTVTIGAY